MADVSIKLAETTGEKSQLDTLLWEVLWEPMGMARNTRDYFRMDCPETEFIAVADGTVVGGLVVFRLGKERSDIRQLAVRSEFQNRRIGGRLMDALVTSVRMESPVIVEVIARSPSIGFYEKQGFTATGFCPEHPDFTRNGLSLHEMILEV